MKKKILPILIAILFTTPVFAIEQPNLGEVVLETPQEEAPQAAAISEVKKPEEKTLKEKLQDVYHLEVEKYHTPTYLLENV